MMKRELGFPVKLFLGLSALVCASASYADEVVTEHYSDGTTVTTTEDTGAHTYLKDEVFGFKPQVGVTSFDNSLNESSSRITAGFTMDLNVTPQTPVFFGPSTGLLVSNVGRQGSNFFGGGGNNVGSIDNTSALILIPANLKLGANLGERMRLSVHGGGNVIRRTNVTTVSIGDATAVNESGSDWNFYPNVGGDLEFGLGQSVGLIIRPDWTLTTGNDVFTGTVGLNFNLG